MLIDDLHHLLTSETVVSQVLAPGGVMAVVAAGALKLFRRQRTAVQRAAADTPDDPDALEVADGIVSRRLSTLERQVRSLVEHLLRLDAWAREHPCTHIPPHPMPTLPMDVLLGVQTTTPPGGTPAVPAPRAPR